MKPKVVIDNEVYRKIMYWVMKSEYEVSGLGNVVFDAKEGTFRVVSAMLLPQVNTSTHTEIDPQSVCKAMYELRDAPGEMKFWWHSHVNMGVFWSAEDTGTIEELGSAGWILATVFNKKNEHRTALYGVGSVIPTWVDQIDTVTTPFVDPMAAQWDAEYVKNVTHKVFTQASPVYTSKTHWWDSREGKWVPNTTTGTTSGSTDTATDDKRWRGFSEPPAIRPVGMTKRDYKAWKKVYRENQEAMRADAAGLNIPGEAIFMCRVTRELVDESQFVQPYPLTQAEITAFAACGIDTAELDYEIANLGHGRQELLELLDDIIALDRRERAGLGDTDDGNPLGDDDGPVDDDIPVADRGRFLS